jgi:simple sugar transport system permease protein
VLFSHNLSVYGSFLAVIAAGWFLAFTRSGLELRAVGERPEAAHARGIPVNRIRYVATLVGGAFVGMAGAAVSLDQIAGWRENLTVNMGWIALAFVIFGGWNPWRVALACFAYRGLLFFAGEFQVQFPEFVQVLTQLPFLLMIFALTVLNTERFRSLGNRFPRLRPILAGEAPTARARLSTPSDLPTVRGVEWRVPWTRRRTASVSTAHSMSPQQNRPSAPLSPRRALACSPRSMSPRR